MVMCAMSSTPASHALTDPRSSDIIVTHPNRDKPVVQSTRATVVLLLLVTVGLLLLITVSGWNVFQSAVPIQIAYIVIYLTLAFFAGRWNRGVLPVGSALAVLLAIFALVAAPGWFERDKTGFEAPNYLNASLLGLLTLLIVPLQVLLVIFAMRGFQQGWNVEVERPSSGERADIYDDPAAPSSVRRIPSRPT
jgi:presenilin-like A22 family membrane protease